MSIFNEKYIIVDMSVREDLKILLVKEKMTLTELAREAQNISGKKYTVHGLSQKMVNNTMKYEEMKFLAGVMGYNIKFEKINIE